MVEDLYNQLKKRNREKGTYSLGEGLSTGSLSEIGVETEGLGDGEVGWLLARFRQRREDPPFMVYIGVPGRCSAEMT